MSGVPVNDTSLTSGLEPIFCGDGRISLSYDPRKWSAPKVDDDGDTTLEHIQSGAFAAVSTEKLGFPLDAEFNNAMKHFRKKHPDAKVVREKRTVNAQQVWCCKTSFAADSTPFMLYGYYYGGVAGTVHVAVCATQEKFGEYEAEFTDFLNSLEIKPPKHALMTRIWESASWAAIFAILFAVLFGLRMAWRHELGFATASGEAIAVLSAVLFAGVFVYYFYKIR
jgi:hypothetical protein